MHALAAIEVGRRARGSWFSALSEDLAWLFETDSKCESLRGSTPAEWTALIRQAPKFLVQRAVASATSGQPIGFHVSDPCVGSHESDAYVPPLPLPSLCLADVEPLPLLPPLFRPYLTPIATYSDEVAYCEESGMYRCAVRLRPCVGQLLRDPPSSAGYGEAIWSEDCCRRLLSDLSGGLC